MAFPTETVYGLGADATNPIAVARIFEAKGRPTFNPLIVHTPNQALAELVGALGPLETALARAFWPGPLTIVARKREGAGIADLVTAGQNRVGLRVPGHALARRLLAATGRPIAAPSANRSGRVSPTSARHVRGELGDRIDLILDGGPCGIGLESTVLRARDGRIEILRPGAVTVEMIRAEIGRTHDIDVHEVPAAAEREDRPQSPGRLTSHYAPRAALRLNARDVRDGEALLAFGRDVPATHGPIFNLSARGDLREAAAKLFAAMRELDESGCRTIAVMAIANEGLGRAINDRLQRAAAPRGQPICDG